MNKTNNMKYVRTKDGIYEVEKKERAYFEGQPWLYYCKWHGVVEEKDILKQADTIEELCDEFVCLENKMTFHNLETITSSCNLKHLTIYGAIWTDKGLIYVAKMNEDGELCLI